METEAALVGTKGRVELDTVTAVDLDLALVGLPDDTELDDTLGNGDDGKASPQLGVDGEELGGLKGGGKLWIDISFKHRPDDRIATYQRRPARIRAQKGS